MIVIVMWVLPENMKSSKVPILTYAASEYETPSFLALGLQIWRSSNVADDDKPVPRREVTR
jgi:hypothetical protein